MSWPNQIYYSEVSVYDFLQTIILENNLTVQICRQQKSRPITNIQQKLCAMMDLWNGENEQYSNTTY